MLFTDFKLTVAVIAERCGYVTTLLCKANPNSTFNTTQGLSWYKDNVTIFRNGMLHSNESDKYKEQLVETKTYNFSLVLYNTTISDNGKYQCSFGQERSNYACVERKCKYK